MPRAVDYDRVAPVYDRRYQINRWEGVESTLRDFVQTGQDVLEVGCGTGHWLGLLLKWGCLPYGIEPSVKMLLRASRHAGDAYLASGCAEELPWRSGSFDRLIAVNALHHFSDQKAFVREARRVLRPGGRIVTIGLDPGRRDDDWYIYDYFPRSLELDLDRYPATADLVRWWEEAGFSHCSTSIAQHIDRALPARARLEEGAISKQSTSQLTLLTDDEYEAGVERLWRAVREAEAQGEELQLRADLRLLATFGTHP